MILIACHTSVSLASASRCLTDSLTQATGLLQTPSVMLAQHLRCSFPSSEALREGTRTAVSQGPPKLPFTPADYGHYALLHSLAA